jgi:SAM-dependent methyltransferase
MSEPLLRVLARMRGHLLDPDTLVKAVASGRQRGQQPSWKRVELRYVDLKAGRHLQVTSYDDTQAHTANHAAPPSTDARDAVDELLDEPFGNWHVETTTQSHQVRVTKKLEALVHTTERAEQVEVDRGHDRDKERLLAEDDPVFKALGLTDAEGRMKPSRHAKYRQVEEFLRLLDTSISDAVEKRHLRRPTREQPLRIADLGCGNAYLTFAAQRFLTEVRGLPVVLTGVDVKEQSREHNARLAGELGVDAEFVVGSISGAVVDPAPEVVLALHACDTATDEALARAVEWGAQLVLAAPCCHHDIAAQLRRAPTPAPYALLTRHGILRERFADTLTDGLRASLMRLQGYRVDVMQFVESQHTPRNTMLRAVRTGGPVTGGNVRREYDELVAAWGLTPRLAVLLAGTPEGPDDRAGDRAEGADA